MAKFFIDRPIFAMALSIIIVLIGAICGFNLPIAQYPNITKPQINVSTIYVGANASTVEQSVAQAIEQKVNGVENMRDMRSTSTNTGQYSLDVYFNLDKNADIGAVEVQNRVSQASSSLPSEVNSYGVSTTKKSSQDILWLTLISPNNTYDSMFLLTYAKSNIVDPVKRVKGVSTVEEFGEEYAMRIQLQPDKMASLGVTVNDIYSAITTQSVQAPVGSIGSKPTMAEQELSYSASASGRLKTPEEFGNVIIRSVDGNKLRVKDVAVIEEGPRMDIPAATLDGATCVAFPIYLTSDANAIDCVDQIMKVVEDARTRLPADMELIVANDKTTFIRESMNKVLHTFIEALLLVLVVVYMFLGNWRATLVPMLAVPVSLIGTFAAFKILGFTINTLSLFALILAIGLVVDDAIVVVEAVEHHIEENGLSPREATYRAMDEVSGPVVAIACVLAAVFLPMSFMGGSTGELYKQFAMTVSVSMMLSAVVALSLTPALCAMLLKPRDEHQGPSKFNFIDKAVAAFNNWFNRTLEKYTNGVTLCIRQTKIVLCAFLVMLVCIGVVAKVTPSGYVPDEDQGDFLIAYNLPEGASSNRGIQQMTKVASEIKQWPGVKYVIAVNGYDILSSAPKSSAGLMQVIMKDFAERDTTTFQHIGRVYGMAGQIPEMNLMAFNAAALPGLSSTGSLGMYVMNLGGDDISTMGQYVGQFLAKANQRPEIGICYSPFSTDTPAYQFEVDREKAEALNVPVSSVYSTLQSFLGGLEVNDFNNFGRIWKVVMQADKKYRGDINTMNMFYVRSNDGKLVPLSTLVKAEFTQTVPTVTRFNGASAFKIAGSPADGYSTGQAMAALEEVAKEVLPTTYTYEWVDQSRDEKEAGDNTIFLYSISLVFVFLCLAALYESWTIPLAVMLSVPPAILGCFGSQLIRGQQNDIYMQVALITLVGLAAKNAILIVEYAVMNYEQGMGIVESAIAAAKLRLRPILMTSFAFILGCLPLATATGASSGARVSMGNAVVGGMTFATFVGIFLIPVMFVVVAKVFEKKEEKVEE
ncbi:MAG: efflux RND transporter permease subunit [Phascolarctobacterium sp.]|nr:efflux RND transporter permease subunit [Phascolarctobacterium sp.]